MENRQNDLLMIGFICVIIVVVLLALFFAINGGAI